MCVYIYICYSRAKSWGILQKTEFGQRDQEIEQEKVWEKGCSLFFCQRQSLQWTWSNLNSSPIALHHWALCSSSFFLVLNINSVFGLTSQNHLFNGSPLAVQWFGL